METERNDNISRSSDDHTRCKCSGVRYIFAVTGFLGMCLNFALRVNMSIAIIAMVNMTAITEVTGIANRTNEPMCGLLNSVLSDSSMEIFTQKDGEFIWTPKMQGVIIGSFYYGYGISQIPGARLSEIYSGKWVFGLGTGLSAVLCLLIPLAARHSTALLIFVRALQGVSQGVIFPSMYNLLGRWTREEERTLVEAIVISGLNIGTVVGMPLAAKLTNSTLFGGWPSAFYVIGAIGCIWFCIWSLFVTNSPEEHACITNNELEHIASSHKVEGNSKSETIPWLKILTFGPYWAVTFTHFIGDWTFFLLLNNLPQFYSTILNFSIETNGYVSSFPYVLQAAVGCLGGYLSDEAIKNDIVTPNFARKICNLLACLGSVVGLGISSIAGCDMIAQVSAFGLTMASGGLWYCSFMISYLDISPEYAGTLMGIASTISSLAGFMTPMFVGALTDNKPTFGQWRIIFGTTIILLIASSIVYHLFATAETQNWDDDHHTQRGKRYRKYLHGLFPKKQKH